MRLQKYVIKSNPLTLVTIGDIHWGNNNVDKKMLNNVIKYVKEHRCYWIGMGDYGDAIIPDDRRFNLDTIDAEYNTPKAQYKAIKELFRPIANKCLGLADGNHDYLHWIKHQHNYVEELAEDLGVPYLQIDCFLRFYFKRYNTNFDVYAHHGWTGARTKGGKINRIYDLEQIFPMCNLYVMGHMHDLGLTDKKINLWVDDDMKIRDKISYFLFSGSFLKGYVADQISYVEEKTYRPSVLGSPVLSVTPKKGKGTVNFNIKYEEVR